MHLVGILSSVHKEERIRRGIRKSTIPAHPNQGLLSRIYVKDNVVDSCTVELVAYGTMDFLRPKMVRVRLLSRGFFSEVSFFVEERPERMDWASEAAELSSKYFSL
jgi:hypothetical protein